MRALIAGAAAVLVVGLATPSPTLAVAASAPSLAVGNAHAHSPGLASTDVRSTQRKKQKATKKKETIAIHVKSTVRRGTRNLEITGKPSTDDRSCEMKIKWNDGTSTDIEKVRANDDRECIFEVDVPRNERVVGEATVEMKVKDSHGKKLASASRVFRVK